MTRPGVLKWLALFGATIGMVALADFCLAASEAKVQNVSKAPASVVVPAAATAGAVGAAARTALAPAAGHGAPKALEHPVWSELNHAQQEALLPLAADWDAIDALRKQKWLKIVNHYSSMKPEEQQRVRENMHDWVKLTPEQRRVIRENYERSKKIDPGTKSAQWEQYQQLPEEQKKKLAADAIVKKQVSSLHPPSKVKPLPPIKSGVLLTPVMPPQTVNPPASTAAPNAPAAAVSAASSMSTSNTAQPSAPASSNVK